MHNLIIYKKYIIVSCFYFVIFIKSISNIFAKECQDFNSSMEEARAYFKYANEIELNYSLRSSFIKNYNKFSKDKKMLKADKIILLTLLDKNQWYIFAGLDNCFVFWVNMEPDKFIEFIDGGSIAKDQGMWRKD
jgi:hypothetical protein